MEFQKYLAHSLHEQKADFVFTSLCPALQLLGAHNQTSSMKNPLTSETLHTAEALQWIAGRPPLIEVCPTSNSFTLNLTDLKDHPTLGTWIKTGYPIAISTGGLSFTFMLCHSMIYYTIVWDSMIWYCALYSTMLCYAVLCNDMLHYTILCHVTLYYAVHRDYNVTLRALC